MPAEVFAQDEQTVIRNFSMIEGLPAEGFSREITLEPKEISITSYDEKFLLKVLALIEEHMDDEKFLHRRTQS
jgi:hypothetical protein